MNILKQLSIKNLKLNKKRAISTIIGIILSCALICAVATMVTSFRATLVQNAINETGYYHIELSKINDNNIKELKNNRDIKDIYITEEQGYAKLENGQNEYKPYLKVISLDKQTFEFLKFNLIEGRFANNSSEIVISKHIVSDGKVDYKIGDKIKLNIGQRKTLDDYDLYPSNLYNKDDEKLVDEKECEFTIVGIIERPEYSFESYRDPGYTVITTNMNAEAKNAYISLKNPREYKTSITELLGAKSYKEVISGAENLKYDQYSINEELLKWEVFAFSNSTISMLYTVCAVVIFIIIFTSVFCIRNSFTISITEKIKMYSMLSSIGATKKQIKKNVIFEAMLLGLIGIPLGILSGIFAVFVLLKIVNSLIGEYLFDNIDGAIFHVSIIPILLSIALGFITIYLSAISSARKAAKINPIEGLRNSDEIKINNKKLKTPKIISKIFKTGGVLAYKNLKRSKKKYRTTVISLAVSIFIFIAMNSFITNAFDLTENYYEDYDYNVRLYPKLDNFPQEDLNKILALDNANESFILYEDKLESIKIKDLSKVNLMDGEELADDCYYDEATDEIVYTGEGKVSNLYILALDNNSFKKYCEKIKVNYEKVKNVGILCDECAFYDASSENTKMFRRYKYSENDTITGKYNKKEFNIKVGAVTDIKPYGMEHCYSDGGYLVVNYDEYKNIMNLTIDTITIDSNDPYALQDAIENINKNIIVSNMDAQIKEEKSMVLVINIFLYGFITVITLIGVTNIFNTITSNMELRQREFATLKSIGMTKKEFNRMINLETIFYCTKALFYGIILGLLGTFAMYKAFAVKIDSGMYIPVKSIILSIIFVFVLVFIIMRYSIGKINKQNTIETIRNENI